MRGAWIEIKLEQINPELYECRAPCGARGLKYVKHLNYLIKFFCRAPCGARGLKSGGLRQMPNSEKSRPMRGAWIEMPDCTS